MMYWSCNACLLQHTGSYGTSPAEQAVGGSVRHPTPHYRPVRFDATGKGDLLPGECN